MMDSGMQSPTAPDPLQAVPLQAVAPPDPLSMYQHGSNGAGVVGNAVVENRGDNRVMQQLRWLEKMVYVCIFLALYAIMKK